MKYIIDIEDEPFEQNGEKLWRAKGFKSLVFDKEGLNRLEKPRKMIVITEDSTVMTAGGIQADYMEMRWDARTE